MPRKRTVVFSKDYLSNSIVQQKQNKKFRDFILSNLKKLDYHPEVLLELGVGDGYLARLLSQSLSSKKFYFVDKNPIFLDLCKKAIPDSVCLQKDFLFISPEDFDLFPDLVVSSNSLHWLPFNETNDSWFTCVKNIFSILKEGGLFFIHHGLKWTYFPLYDLASELFEEKYGYRIDLSDYLYYPSRSEIIKAFRAVEFKVVDVVTFYENDVSPTLDYTRDELYKSFSSAGLNAFLAEIQNEEERKSFKEMFINLCHLYKPPVFSHRGFFCLRKPLSRIHFKLISCAHALQEEEKIIRLIIDEVSDDFYPPLNERLPDDKNFDSGNRDKTESYTDALIRNYWNLIAFAENTFTGKSVEPAGILSFRYKDSFTSPGNKCVYISTFAVRRKFRNTGVAKKLFEYFFDRVLMEVFPEAQIKLVETRTWSTNVASKSLLEKMGFVLEKRLKNHRGEGVHTDYYIKKLN